MPTIIEKDGLLYVQENWYIHLFEPIRSRINWSTGLKSSEFYFLIGCECCCLKSGGQFIGYETIGLSKNFLVEVPSNANPAFVDKEVIPKPRGKSRWHLGKWCR